MPIRRALQVAVDALQAAEANRSSGSPDLPCPGRNLARVRAEEQRSLPGD